MNFEVVAFSHHRVEGVCEMLGALYGAAIAADARSAIYSWDMQRRRDASPHADLGEHDLYITGGITCDGDYPARALAHLRTCRAVRVVGWKP